VSIFVGNSNSLNGVTEELANQLQLNNIEHSDDIMRVMLGYNQTVQRPKRTTFTVMPVPEGKDVMLGMKWLRENNPDIDWERLLLRPRTPLPRSHLCSWFFLSVLPLV
ncbi:hypothetical protein PHMEG_00022550, partial [Phytophthora megakarya]